MRQSQSAFDPARVSSSRFAVETSQLGPKPSILESTTKRQWLSHNGALPGIAVPLPETSLHDHQEEEEVNAILNPGRGRACSCPGKFVICVITLIAITLVTFRLSAVSSITPRSTWAHIWPDSPLAELSAMHVVLSDYSKRIAILEQTIYNLSRDSVGRQDFASRFSGSHIISNLTTRGFPSDNPPDVALDEDLRPGRCWLIHGSAGQLGVTLKRPVSVSHFTIDHVPKELAWDMRNAPRTITVWGILDPLLHPVVPTIPMNVHTATKGPLVTGDYNFTALAYIQYDIAQPSSHIQTYPVFGHILEQHIRFGGFVFEIQDNWGNNSTCLYRVRVHGTA